CFRRFGLRPAVCVLGGLAAALNTNALSISCWGLYAWVLSRAGVYLALAALAGGTGMRAWLRAALGGLLVGLALMDGFDVGAIYSLYIAAFVIFQRLSSPGSFVTKLVTGATRVAV